MPQQKLTPALFGINKSNRDFTQKDTWGKNQFNSSFPAALACYMASQNIVPIYLKLGNDFDLIQDWTEGSEIMPHIPISPERRFDAIICNSPDLFN